MDRKSPRPPYRKPFQAVPIELGQVYRAKHRRSWMRRQVRTVSLYSAIAIAVFGGGMLVTNWTSVAGRR